MLKIDFKLQLFKNGLGMAGGSGKSMLMFEFSVLSPFL